MQELLSVSSSINTMATSFTTEYTAIQKKLDIANPHAVPRITAVVLNVGVGKSRDSKQHLEAVRRDMALISGQHPHERLARKAIAGFNVRQGNIVAYRVTLHGKRMEDFVKRFVHVTLPRVRDFRGLSPRSIDNGGNLNVGLKEQLPFPEIHPEETDIIFGIQVTFVTSAKNKEEAEILFRTLGFPLVEKNQENN